ncbi:MAG: leucine-rich repeat protein [Clostridia bacterium]|nr:leucine-rich repeat protein [Clostridia bacterium]
MKVPIKLFTASLVLAVCITLMSGCLNIAGNEQQSTSDIPTQISTELPITEYPSSDTASPMTSNDLTTGVEPVTEPVYTDDKEYSHSFIRAYLDSAVVSEIFKNIKYNVDNNGSVHGVYEERRLMQDGVYKWCESFEFDIVDNHLFCPTANTSQIREIESFTERRIHSVTFTDNSCTIEGDINGYNNAESYYVQKNNTLYRSVDGVIFTADLKTLVLFPALRSGHYDVPDGVEYISDGAFGKSRLESISLPSSLKSVGKALKNSHALEVIYLRGEQACINANDLSPYVCATVVYSNTKPDTGISASVSLDAVGKTDITDTESVLYIPEGITSLLELDLESVGKTDYTKVVIPSTIRSLPNVHMIKTEYFEVSPDNTTYYSENGAIYRQANNCKILVAYPALRNGTFYVESSDIFIGTYAFRGSSIEEFHLGLGQMAPNAFNNCLSLEKFTTVGPQDIIIEFEDSKVITTVFYYDGQMKTQWPDFDPKVTLLFPNGSTKISPTYSGNIYN